MVVSEAIISFCCLFVSGLLAEYLFKGAKLVNFCMGAALGGEWAAITCFTVVARIDISVGAGTSAVVCAFAPCELVYSKLTSVTEIWMVLFGFWYF